jgi:hypothetical protein
MKSDFDDLPSYEGKRLVRERYKRSDDFPYRHAKRWIETKVGEDFDKVFSEWTKLPWLPARFRNLDSLKRHIETEIVFGENDEVFCFSYGNLFRIGNALYLDPKTNKILFAKPLKKRNWKKENEAKLARRCIFLSDYHQLCKIDGIWYEIHLNPSVKVMVYDWRLKKYVQKTSTTKKDEPYTDSIWKTLVLKSMKQLDTKALRSYNLKND